VNTVKIRREAEGYHINLGSPDLDFTPSKIENHSKLLPAVRLRKRPNQTLGTGGEVSRVFPPGRAASASSESLRSASAIISCLAEQSELLLRFERGDTGYLGRQ